MTEINEVEPALLILHQAGEIERLTVLNAQLQGRLDAAEAKTEYLGRTLRMVNAAQARLERERAVLEAEVVKLRGSRESA